jgi:hypothetical protein
MESGELAAAPAIFNSQFSTFNFQLNLRQPFSTFNSQFSTKLLRRQSTTFSYLCIHRKKRL